SGLASTTDPARRSDELRPAVQVGNPFLEKLLMEACLDLAHNHPEWIAGIQDLGAAGLTAASMEAAARAGTGLVVDVAKVPRREAGMTPYEVMLSESQERMLIIVRRGHENDVGALFQRWEVPWATTGRVTDDGLARVLDADQEVACLPIDILTDPPLYTRQPRRPPELDQLQSTNLSALPDVQDPSAALLRLMAFPNLSSRGWIYHQYDHHLFTNTVISPGGDAALLRIKGTSKAIALTTDGNGRYCYLDPYQGGAIAVAEAARNVVCTGATPIAVTDCLNFGNPQRPEIYYQMEQVIRGIAAACQKLGVPVVSGNVSLYNETQGQAVYPTPVIGMLGLLEDVSHRCAPAFQREGDAVFLLGAGLEAPASTLGGSEYLKEVHGLAAGRPHIDLDTEVRTQQACLAAIAEGLLSSCHDCADGGLAVALAEACIASGLGLDASGLRISGRLDAALFGEAQSRFVVSCRSEAGRRLETLAEAHDIPIAYLGQVKGRRLVIGPYIDATVTELRRVYEGGLPAALQGTTP
ncbi:MAG: AIR synthase-related protein, partial [Dehalococcoidia bacterium]